MISQERDAAVVKLRPNVHFYPAQTHTGDQGFSPDSQGPEIENNTFPPPPPLPQADTKARLFTKNLQSVNEESSPSSKMKPPLSPKNKSPPLCTSSKLNGQPESNMLSTDREAHSKREDYVILEINIGSGGQRTMRVDSECQPLVCHLR